MKNNFIKRLAFFCAILLALIIVRFSNISSYFTLDMIKAHRLYLLYVVKHYYAMAVGWYIGLYIIVVLLSLPAAALLTLSGGYFFGTIPGLFFTNIGATIGATGIFLVTRSLIGIALQEKYQNRLALFNKAIEQHGIYYLLGIRMIAVIPFFVVNILAALSTVPLWTYIWTTSLGILPVSFVYSYAGQQLATIESLKDIFTWQIVLALCALGLLALAPVLIKKIKR